MKQSLKRITPLRLGVQKLRIFKEFLSEARFFSQHLLDGNKTLNHEQYYILMRAHSIEKGLAHRKRRSFGARKVKDLIRLLSTIQPNSQDTWIIEIGKCALVEWRNFHANRADRDEKCFREVSQFLEITNLNGFESNVLIGVNESLSYTDLTPELLTTRRSIRSYADRYIEDETIRRAIEVANTAPSACNRQPTRVHIFRDPLHKDLIKSTVHGSDGVDFEHAVIALVSYDSRAFEFFGERNQGWVNSGLFTMNFLLGLHSLGLGSCLMQFGVSFKEERVLKSLLHIPEHERIVVSIAFGYSHSKSMVPLSARRLPSAISIFH